MARYTGPACKLCRREGKKLYLKGERCVSGKCALERRTSAPGQHGADAKKMREYGMQLREKQTTKRYYGVLEKQFRNLYEEAHQLNASIEEYKQVFAQQQDLDLLKKALVGGEISMIEYFVEVGIVFQSKANLINLENQYQKAMARLYQNKL